MSTLPSTMPDSLARCAIAVAAYFGDLFSSLEAIGAKVGEAFEHHRPLNASTLSDVVQPLAATTLADHPVVGAGFVARPGWLADRELFLAWWQGEEQTLLAERGVPLGHHVFDYTRHEWFQTPLATGERHVTGPYVDYVCTDEYVLTATAPVLVGGQMAGVAGADTRLETFEELMREALSGDVVLVNGHDRCVVATDPLLRSGQKVHTAAYAVVHPVPGLPFRVLGSA
jgi:hypothetical protein